MSAQPQPTVTQPAVSQPAVPSRRPASDKSPDLTRRPIRRALVSVYDKTGLEDLGRALAGAGVEIVSTGSTAATLASCGLAVTPVEQLTGFPECLDGRVKTLHPRVHAGILADTRVPAHLTQLQELGIEPFELVVVNLYPFEQTVAGGAAPDECVEQIDIGGPSMVRAAAKNHPSVAVVVSPASYPQVIEALGSGGFTLAQRRELAARAFAHTAAYDVAVAGWMAQQVADAAGEQEPGTAGDAVVWPQFLGATFTLGQGLRYGENPHQRAALYRDGTTAGLAHAEVLHGKPMSYNNYVDADAAWRAAWDFESPAVAIIKHANPCGIAIADTIAQAHAKAHACDPVSAYGGVIAANRPIDEEAARQIAEVFTEVVVAPAFTDAALAVLRSKKNLRLLRVPRPPQAGLAWREVSGGMLVQQVDRIDAPGDNAATWQKVAGVAVPAPVLADLEFAWRAVRAVKSNAILLASKGATVGVGMGQVNRVDSCSLAVQRAGAERARGAVAASDAFFPFSDGLEVLARAGVRAVVEPGGSVRDAEVIEAAARAGITVYFTSVRHFSH